MQQEKLENLCTPELDKRLQAELRKEIPDAELVRGILRVLEEREKNMHVEVTPEIQAAWDRFNTKERRRTEQCAPMRRNWLTRVVVSLLMVAVVLVLLMRMVPVEAQAGSWWDKFMSWTASRFSVLDLGRTDSRPTEYVFKTDNDGLQKVYDAVSELGVTVPVVPMWLPSGYTLVEYNIISMQAKDIVYATFNVGGNLLVYQAEVFEQGVLHEYQKDDADVTNHEINGITYNVIRNNGRLVAVWNNENVECFLSVECGEEDFLKF